MNNKSGPNKPDPRPASLNANVTAVAVLDLSARCENPEEVCSKLLEPVGAFLELARASRVPIIYTVSVHLQGTAQGQVAAPLKRRASEPVIYPDAFDKFAGGELQGFLSQRGVRNVVVVGSLTNVAVLYTCSAAVRVYDYTVVLPLDGVNAHTQYEHEYAIHQFTIQPEHRLGIIAMPMPGHRRRQHQIALFH